MKQPLMLQNECVDCPFGQCYDFGDITDEIQKECVKEKMKLW